MPQLNVVQRPRTVSECSEKSDPNHKWSAERQRKARYAIQLASGSPKLFGDDDPEFVIGLADEGEWENLLQAGAYSAALAFVKGKVTISGDIVAAVRLYKARSNPSFLRLLGAVVGLYAPARLETWAQSRGKAVRNIRFHYDRSNDFYRQFLDSRMVYSCAYFGEGVSSLEEAQLSKLEHICRKLCLENGEEFLDIGCGWGALVMHAASMHGTRSTGCTLSSQQLRFAQDGVNRNGLADRVSLFECDYREMKGPFNKIASVGMFEHVGKRRLPEYFAKLYDLLDDDGLVLNHGITRPEPVGDGPETVFIHRKVFPGGELPHLSEVVRTAEDAGFEVLDVENLRCHYARTCHAWVQRLQANEPECLKHVDPETFRTWVLFLAASAVKFDEGFLGLHQVLLSKRGRRRQHPMTRDYMYRGPAARTSNRATQALHSTRATNAAAKSR
jgi:cyclopropane-fatty-acyl-phospholipid synthase